MASFISGFHFLQNQYHRKTTSHHYQEYTFSNWSLWRPKSLIWVPLKQWPQAMLWSRRTLLSHWPIRNNKTNTIDFINDVQEGETYTCHNLRVIKEYKSDNLALGMTLQDCTLSESEYFPEPVAQPLEVPDSFTTTKIEIKGLTAFGRYLSCLQCHKNCLKSQLLKYLPCD